MRIAADIVPYGIQEIESERSSFFHPGIRVGNNGKISFSDEAKTAIEEEALRIYASFPPYREEIQEPTIDDVVDKAIRNKNPKWKTLKALWESLVNITGTQKNKKGTQKQVERLIANTKVKNPRF